MPSVRRMQINHSLTADANINQNNPFGKQLSSIHDFVRVQPYHSEIPVLVIYPAKMQKITH